jgi:hypothetical protein
MPEDVIKPRVKGAERMVFPSVRPKEQEGVSKTQADVGTFLISIGTQFGLTWD